jgi:hypothetical protein
MEIDQAEEVAQQIREAGDDENVQKKVITLNAKSSMDDVFVPVKANPEMILDILFI